MSALGGTPLGLARVSLIEVRHPQNRMTLVTAEDGRFEFLRVAAGKYSLQGSKRGFIAAAYDEHEQYSTAIVTGAGLDTEHLVLRLVPSAVLGGKILDEAGEGVRHAMVTLYREDHSTGVNRILRWRNDATDDQGAYEFSGLAPGTYYLSAAATPWYAVHPSTSNQQNQAQTAVVDSTLDVAYATTYYQDASEPDDALPIPLKGGDDLEVTIHLTPVPSLRLRFRAPDNGANGFTMPSLERPSLDGTDFVQSNGAQMISPGLWEMSGVAAGRYSVQLPAQSFGSGIQSNMEVNVTTDGEEVDTSKGEASASVKASVALTGNAPIPVHLVIQFRDAKMRIAAGEEVNAKGEVEFENVPPGQYDLLAESPNQAYSVIEISSQGHTTSGHVLNVTSGTSVAVGLMLSRGSTNVEGFVQRSEKASAGAMVVLVPQHPEANRELFRRDQSDLDGSFVLPQVVPGRYTIVAIENGWDLDWSSAGVISYYLRHGQTVAISDSGKSSLHLTSPVEVQSK